MDNEVTGEHAKAVVMPCVMARFNSASNSFAAKPNSDNFKALEDAMYALQRAKVNGLTDGEWIVLYKGATFHNIIEKLLEGVKR
jgi:hypothetical protein